MAVTRVLSGPSCPQLILSPCPHAYLQLSGPRSRVYWRWEVGGASSCLACLEVPHPHPSPWPVPEPLRKVRLQLALA